MESGSPADACCVPLGAGTFLPGPWQAFMENSINEFEDEAFIFTIESCIFVTFPFGLTFASG
jgi:hypothetical protein